MNQSGMILIVDDSKTIRTVLKLSLEKEGFIVREAANSKTMDLLLKENKHMIKLILMDINLGDENGFDLVDLIRENKEYSKISIIMLSMHTEKDNVLIAKAKGVDGYLKKPVNMPELIKRMNAVLNSDRSTKSSL